MAKSKSTGHVSKKSNIVALPPPAKDEEEEELERLVFGDLQGFHVGIRETLQDSSDEEDADQGFSRDSDARSWDKDLTAVPDDELFVIDVPTVHHSDDESGGEEKEKKDGAEKKSKAAWEDSDDERVVVSLADNPRLRKLRVTEDENLISGKDYQKRLRRQYHRVYPIPEWALPSNKRKSKKRHGSDASSSSSEESDYGMEVEEVATEPLAKLLSAAGSSWTKKSIRLMPEKIEITRLQDANQARPSHSGISAVSFHPTHPLLLSAGLDSTVRLFHIDGKINPAATSLHLKKTPIRSAQFHAGGRKVFLSGRRRYFHVWDLESGAVEKVTQIGSAQNQELQRSTEKFKLSPDGRYMALAAARGVVNILDAKNCMWVTSAKVEGKVADMAWYPDGEGLAIASKGSEVIEFNMRTGTVESRWRDEGFGTTTIALGGKDSGRWCAIGSESGVVNVYDRINGLPNSGSGYAEIAPKPARVLEQLVTPVSLLEFSGDAQVLAMASHGKTDALRLVHLPSLSVYKNWPTSSTPLGRVNCAAWSPGTSNGMLAVGNEQGKVRLWEIR